MIIKLGYSGTEYLFKHANVLQRPLLEILDFTSHLEYYIAILRDFGQIVCIATLTTDLDCLDGT